MALQSLTIEYLDKCNLSCAHCAVNASPQGKEKLSLQDALDCILAAKDYGARDILITGGEPFLVVEELYELAGYCKKMALNFHTFSNAFWADNPAEAKKMLDPLCENGLTSLHLSLDCFHIKEGVKIENLVNIAAIAKSRGVKIIINVLRDGGKTSNKRIKNIFKNYTVKFEYEPVMPMGRAAKMGIGDVRPRQNRRSIKSGCRSYFNPVISPSGNVFACDGAYLLAKKENPLCLGNIYKTSIRDILGKFCGLKLLDFISTFGPQSACELVYPKDKAALGSDAYICEYCCNLLNSSENALSIAAKIHNPGPDIKMKLSLADICRENAYRLQTGDAVLKWRLYNFCRLYLPTFLAIRRFLMRSL